jgi:tetratricopeptide (TPR) repeat protein
MLWAGLSLLLVAAQAAAPTLSDALKLLDGGRYPEAVKSLETLSRDSPDDLAITFNLGLAYGLAGQDAQAIECYGKVLKAKPDLYEGQVNLGQLLLKSATYDEAELWLDRAHSTKPAEWKPAFLLAQCMLAQGKLPEAEARFREAVTINPQSSDSWRGLARTESLQKHPQEALDAMQKAVQVEPGNQDFVLELAGMYEAAGKTKEAISLYEKVPADPAARERLGNLLIEDNRSADAIPLLEAAQSQSPTPANRYALAMAYIRNKQPANAVPLLEKVLEAEPDNTAVRMAYGRLLRDQRKFGAAAQQFQQVAVKRPAVADAWSELAASLILDNRHTEALEALEQVRKLKGESPAYWYFRALCFDTTKQYKPALESYQKFLAMSKDQNPDEEFKARQRVRIIQKVLSR